MSILARSVNKIVPYFAAGAGSSSSFFDALGFGSRLFWSRCHVFQPDCLHWIFAPTATIRGREPDYSSVSSRPSSYSFKGKTLAYHVTHQQSGMFKDVFLNEIMLHFEMNPVFCLRLPNATCLVAALWHFQGLKGHPWPWKQRSADPSPPQGPLAAVSVVSHNLTKRLKYTQLSWNSGWSKNVNFSEHFEEFFFLSKDSRTSEQQFFFMYN